MRLINDSTPSRRHDHPLEHVPARLAQLAERKALNLVVVGSSPTSGDILFLSRPLSASGLAGRDHDVPVRPRM